MIPSTTTLPFLRSTDSTVPRLPESFPETTSTVSPLRMCIFINSENTQFQGRKRQNSIPCNRQKRRFASQQFAKTHPLRTLTARQPPIRRLCTRENQVGENDKFSRMNQAWRMPINGDSQMILAHSGFSSPPPTSETEFPRSSWLHTEWLRRLLRHSNPGAEPFRHGRGCTRLTPVNVAERQIDQFNGPIIQRRRLKRVSTQTNTHPVEYVTAADIAELEQHVVHRICGPDGQSVGDFFLRNIAGGCETHKIIKPRSVPRLSGDGAGDQQFAFFVQRMASFSFASAGAVTITLTATDDEGVATSTSRTLQIT